MNSYAPIVVFAYNRCEHLKRLIESLRANTESINSDLYVYVDGPKADETMDVEKVRQVQDYVKSISGFKSVNYFFSSTNKGASKSIIDGVSEVIDKSEKVIVLEEDLVLCENCISFFNQGLTIYASDKQVFSICGYSHKVKSPVSYNADSYFCVRSSPWGWAIWKDRWLSIDWNLESWTNVEKNKWAFNKWGGSDCWRLLSYWKNGKIDAWDVRLWYNQFISEKMSLFPMKSLLKNEGFDGSGTNCRRWSRFVCDLDTSCKKDFVWPKNIAIEENLYKDAMSYNRIGIRIWSRVMYILSDLRYAMRNVFCR